jgi:hypothetical protein
MIVPSSAYIDRLHNLVPSAEAQKQAGYIKEKLTDQQLEQKKRCLRCGVRRKPLAQIPHDFLRRTLITGMLHSFPESPRAEALEQRPEVPSSRDFSATNIFRQRRLDIYERIVQRGWRETQPAALQVPSRRGDI